MTALSDFQKLLTKKLLAVDPGYLNLRNSIRSTIAIIISFFAIQFLAKTFQKPPTLAFLGVMMALIGSIAVSDSNRKQQLKTFLMLPIAALMGLTIAIVLHDHSRLRLVMFLFVTFFAVSIRRFGPRWFTLGFVSFMGFCTSLFFPIPVQHLAWVAGAIYLSVAILMILRFLILPDVPSKIFQLYLISFKNQSYDLVSKTLLLLKDISADSLMNLSVNVDRNRDSFRKSLLRLNELSLTIETTLNATDSHALQLDKERIQNTIFDCEVGLRQILYLLETLLAQPDLKIQDLLPLIADFELAVDHIKNKNTFRRDGISPTVDSNVGTLAYSIQKELQLLCNTLLLISELESPQLPLKRSTNKPISPKSEDSSNPQRGLHLSTRQAIQATLATALASVLGTMVSAERWYWASLAAFVVFAGASRGETLHRATVRVVGTFAGLLLGFPIAYLLSGHHALEWSLVLLCVFVGLFGSRLAFGFWTAFCFTLMFLFLYDVMGLLTLNILILRFEETAVGAAIAALVSGLIFPLSTRAHIRSHIANLLLSVRNVMADLPLDVSQEGSKKDLVRKIKAMDQELLNLRNATAPVTMKTSVLRKGDVPIVLFDATVLVHFVRFLATRSQPQGHSNFAEIQEKCQSLATELNLASKRIANRKSAPQAKTEFAQQANLPITDSNLLHILERIHQTLSLLEKRRI